MFLQSGYPLDEQFRWQRISTTEWQSSWGLQKQLQQLTAWNLFLQQLISISKPYKKTQEKNVDGIKVQQNIVNGIHDDLERECKMCLKNLKKKNMLRRWTGQNLAQMMGPDSSLSELSWHWSVKWVSMLIGLLFSRAFELFNLVITQTIFLRHMFSETELKHQAIFKLAAVLSKFKT